ncbi:hypothetical protein PtB15_15B171 [Puccinia triticina]|nr:hypothetical protein PtB15_15B171 [Puccinia triticina]
MAPVDSGVYMQVWRLVSPDGTRFKYRLWINLQAISKDEVNINGPKAPSDPNHINNSNTRGAASPTMQHPHEPRFNTDLLGQLSSNLSSATNFNHLSDKFTSENDNSDAARHLF